MIDKYNRDINYLRLSLTNNCNLRCSYCMPKDEKGNLDGKDIITMDEAFEYVKFFSQMGVKRVRLTGGEPLVRDGVTNLIKRINSLKGIEEIALTTNGILLDKYFDDLVSNGLKSVNISLDSLKSERYSEITGGGNIEKVFSAIKKAKGKLKVKINSIIIKDFNDDEVFDLIAFANENSAKIRFIELMPIGLGKNHIGIKNEELKKIIEDKSKLTKIEKENNMNGPAEYFMLENGMKVGFISSISNCFCSECNRLRITADTCLKNCLYYKSTFSMREIFKENTTLEEKQEKVLEYIGLKLEKHEFQIEHEDKESKIMSEIGG